MSEEHDISALNGSVERVACPSCSGPMTFSPKTQALTCGYCGFQKALENEGDIPHFNFYEVDEHAEHSWEGQIKSIHCESCGATANIDTKDTTATCPFCDSQQLISSETSEGIQPHGVVPFTISNKEAFALFEKWIKKRFFAKRAVKNSQDSDRLKGVYIPYWTFDVITITDYHVEIGYNYTVMVTKTVMQDGKEVTKQVPETRIRWEYKQGCIKNTFDALLANGSKQFNSDKINALEPFDMRLAKPYNTDYISGFIAQKYDISLKDSFEGLKPQINSDITHGIKRYHRGDHLRHPQLSITYRKIEFQHLLLPVWLSSYRYNGKFYQFAINGQTGEVQGTYPIDWIKVSIVIAIILALIGAYFYYQKVNGGYSSYHLHYVYHFIKETCASIMT